MGRPLPELNCHGLKMSRAISGSGIGTLPWMDVADSKSGACFHVHGSTEGAFKRTTSSALRANCFAGQDQNRSVLIINQFQSLTVKESSPNPQITRATSPRSTTHQHP